MMTPSEAKAPGGAAHITAKKMGNDTINRKASFKCHVPNKTTSQKITRKIVLPMSSVQALTFKFNELSQTNQVQKHKTTQSTVKNKAGGNGKSGTLKVVICRKPSMSKYKRTDDVVVRKRINVMKYQSGDLDEKENSHKNVHQKIFKYEEMKKMRVAKMQVPKILVDIDLSVDNCSNNHKISNSSNNLNEPQSVNEENLISVRAAINLFEKSSSAGVFDKKNINLTTKPINKFCAKQVTDVRPTEEFHIKTSFDQEVKTKPIAAIKPILKKPEDKGDRKPRLSPKNSINRKKYIALKRQHMRNTTEVENEMKILIEENDNKQNQTLTNAEDGIPHAQSDISQRLKNNSSLHKEILQSSFTMITEEIFLNEDKTEQIENVSQNIKPNTSFLWSKKEDLDVEKRSNRVDLPLPVPPDVVPKITDSADFLYDDVRPINEKSEEKFDKIIDSEEDTYDDVGVYWGTNESNFQTENCNKNNLLEEVRNKNILNEITSMQSTEALYDCPEKCLYSYDDGEGEMYQYISDTSDIVQGVAKQSELEVYQYIQNNNNNNNNINDINNDNNIYEDIQSIRSSLTGKNKAKDIYEDVFLVPNSSPDNASIINCYEAVYNGIYSNSNGSQAYIKSDLSDTSNNSGKSAYEKSNSLYGMSTGSAVESHCLNLVDVTDSLKNSSYHLPVFNSANSNSETSNSDEWIEVSESESEETVYVVHERPKKVKSGSTWTQKERRRWKRLQKKTNINFEMKLGKSSHQFYQEDISDLSTLSGSSSESSVKKRPHVGDIVFISSHSVIYLGDFENKIINLHAYDFQNENEKLKIFFTIPRPVLRKKFKPSPSIRVLLYRTCTRECQEVTLHLEEEVQLQNSEDHLYESVGQYENVEPVVNETPKTIQPELSHTVIKDQIYNDEPYVDDFDSQSSEDETFVNARLPDLPSHGYNITKSLKAAGQKLRKNFSLRKSDLSKSLKRFKKSRPKVSEAVFVDNKEFEMESASKTETPSTPTSLSNSIYFNNSDSSSSSRNLNKSVSSDCVKASRHRKSWTFRSKFKGSSLVDSSDSAHAVDSNRNSTFYLSLNDIQPKATEKKDELLNEILTVLSKRSSNSSESFVEKLDKDSNLRHSDGGATVVKCRPNVPPPPPPPSVVNKVETTEKTKYSDLLWGDKTNNSLYLESGLFDKQKKHSRFTDSDSSLYAEIGLYATSGEVSCKKTQMFTDEPLYQFYTECVNQKARDDILNNYDSEGYEEINDFYSVINEKRRTIDIKNVRPNFEDFNDDVRPKIASFRSITDRRTLWCHIPAVIDSCVLDTLSDQAKKLQEAKFEIVTSEASYMKSLNVLENHFMKKVGDLNMISKRDFRILFSNIVAVKKCSESFLEDLEKCWEDNIMLNGICDIVYKHATTSFQVYTKYCKNQVCIYRTLRELIDKNSNFESALKEMENDPICQNLNIHSFLMLPMQRITRLPLLMGAVLARLDKTDDEFGMCKASFDVLNKIVQDCDDEARRMEKCEEMLILSQQIEFPKDIRRIPIITGSRFLVKSGQVTQLINRDENKLTFGKKFSKVSLTLFLFTDLLIIAKKKNIRNYVVVDHCPRNLVQMQTTEGLTQLPVKLTSNSEMGGKLLMLLTMLENHEKKTVEMILSFEMESDRQRWLEAVTPKLSENPDECIYEEWDCPQVISLYEFTPAQPDELNLCIGDVVNVLKKMNDGWYQGERLRDGARGWFPQNHTQEISSSHVRAKNKKLRYRLLALSGNLIDSQKVNGK